MIGRGIILAAVFAAAAVSAGEFLAVSAAPDDTGGVYRVVDGKAQQLASVPDLFHLVRDKKSGILYGAVRKGFGAKKRCGAVVVLTPTADGQLQVAQTLPIPGRTPCFITLAPDKLRLYTANYSSGDLSEIPLDADGRIAGEARSIRHTGHGPTPRQKSPHPHCALFDPAGKQLYVCDLGTDRIHVYDWTPGKGINTPAAAELPLPPGSGPRHLVFSPDGNILYVANELNSTAAVFVRNAQGEWRFKTAVPTLKNPGDKPNYPGAIKLSADAGTLFVTNRGDNSISCFDAAPDGNIKLHGTIPAGGDYPSDLIISADGKILAVANFKSGSVTTPDGTVELKQAIALCP